jgi:bifunctional non-homologous end joining protein LigD
MVAAAGRKAFDDSDWSFELKYHGFRALLFLDSAGMRFISTRGSNLIKRFPELEQIGAILKGTSLVLDGEIIAGNGSIPSFQGLLHRYAKSGITELKPKDRVPVKYVAFDVLVFNGRAVVDEPLKSRQERLRKLIPKSGARIIRVKTVVRRGLELFAEAESHGFEGIIAKRLNSPYESGRRSKNWLMIKSKANAGESPLRRNVFNK